MILKGKMALVTGGSGIGAAVAKRFVAEGAKVCIAGRRAERLEAVVRSLPAGTAVACAGDVSDPEQVERMVETAPLLAEALTFWSTTPAWARKVPWSAPIWRNGIKRWRSTCSGRSC